MKPEPLPVIPVTARVRWRLFRERVVPAIMFSCLVGVTIIVWSRYYGAPTLNGIGEGIRAAVSSPQPGWLRELKVRPYQLVNQGDPIAVIDPVDVRTPLDLLQVQMQLARLRLDPSVADQNAMNYERVRVEWLRLQAELATARVSLARAENELHRDEQLYREKILSEDLYDLSAKTRDAFAAEVVTKSNAVSEIGQRMLDLRALGDPQMAAVDDRLKTVLAGLETAEAGAISNLGPITVLAPISGMVSGVSRQVGEFVQDGETIVGVSSLDSQRVLAYLRQPYRIDPEVGMKVRIGTRTEKRETLVSSIVQVGAQVETITNALAFVRQGSLVDVGLPVVIGLPAKNHIRPGEIVDLWIER